MFKFIKKKEKPGVLNRLQEGLKRTRSTFSGGLGKLLLGKKSIEPELFDQIETLLLKADVGVETTNKIIQDLTKRSSRRELKDGSELFNALKADLNALLTPCSKPLIIPDTPKPFVILVVGVNGNGKTTTIGKLAKQLQVGGKSVILAAGDTYRAAAIEQLKIWGERNNVPVIAQQSGSDSASVIFDAISTAKARNVDVVIADTAGRLHTQQNLMEELKKIKRVMAKLDDTAPHEILLVIDAGTGQNAIQQTEQFNEALGLTGLALTKLDGTAKGGVIFAIANKTGLPIRFIGVGEGIDDLRPFSSDEFVTALFTETTDSLTQQ